MLKNFYLNAPHLFYSKAVVEVILQYMTYIFFILKKTMHTLCFSSKTMSTEKAGVRSMSSSQKLPLFKRFLKKTDLFYPKNSFKKNPSLWEGCSVLFLIPCWDTRLLWTSDDHSKNHALLLLITFCGYQIFHLKKKWRLLLTQVCFVLVSLL